MATLFLVATPIGNLEDMTLRAIRVLKEVSVIAAEDTRHSGRLLKHFAIETALTSFHDYSDDGKLSYLIDRLASEDVALISDAGTPAISDPGFRLVQAAIAAGHQVVPIPGANAGISALVASGLPTDKFLFLGFLPQKQKGRRDALQAVAALPYSLVVYESPKRLGKLLADVEAIMGNRPICVARELTKLHEQLWRGYVGDSAEYLAQTNAQRGEITLIIGGASQQSADWDEATVRSNLSALLASGLSRSKAAAQIASQSNWTKNEIYDLDL